MAEQFKSYQSRFCDRLQLFCSEGMQPGCFKSSSEDNVDDSEDDSDEDETMSEYPTASDEQESEHVRQSEQISAMACCDSDQGICEQVCDLNSIVQCVEVQMLVGDSAASGKVSGIDCRCRNLLGAAINELKGASLCTSGVCANALWEHVVGS